MRALIIASLALLRAARCFAQSGAQSGSALAAIEKLDQRDAQAAKIDDVETLVSLWTDDGVLLQPFSDAVVGKAAIERVLRQQKQASEQARFKTIAYDEDWTEHKNCRRQRTGMGFDYRADPIAKREDSSGEGVSAPHPCSSN
jgi:hypothetical protein